MLTVAETFTKGTTKVQNRVSMLDTNVSNIAIAGISLSGFIKDLL